MMTTQACVTDVILLWLIEQDFDELYVEHVKSYCTERVSSIADRHLIYVKPAYLYEVELWCLREK